MTYTGDRELGDSLNFSHLRPEKRNTRMIPTKPSDSTRRRYVKNIVDTYNRATPGQKGRGREWYHTAHQLAEFLSEGNVKAGAGVIAALSANKAWDLNQKLARRAFDGDVSGHTGANLAKVARILAGVDPEDVLPMDAKTGNFYRCILDPQDQEAVCIDRHAHDVAVGRPWGDDERGLSSKGRYAVLSLAYRNAAAKVGVTPSVMQATVWVVWTESLAGVGRRPTVERYEHDSEYVRGKGVWAESGPPSLDNPQLDNLARKWSEGI